MRIPALLFGLVLAAGLLVLLVALGLPDLAQVEPHPDHPTLLRGTDGGERSAPLWWIGSAFGLVQIAFFGACFALGLSRGGSLGRLARPIGVGLALYAAVFLLLIFSDRAFVSDPAGAPLVLGFPAPTAVMLYGLWPVPLWFLWLYLRHFDEQVLSAEDVERVRRIAREVAAEDEPS